jgi:hypothetical protein
VVTVKILVDSTSIGRALIPNFDPWRLYRACHLGLLKKLSDFGSAKPDLALDTEWQD